MGILKIPLSFCSILVKHTIIHPQIQRTHTTRVNPIGVDNIGLTNTCITLTKHVSMWGGGRVEAVLQGFFVPFFFYSSDFLLKLL